MSSATGRCEQLEALLSTHGVAIPALRDRDADAASPLSRGLDSPSSPRRRQRDPVTVAILNAALDTVHRQQLPIHAFFFTVGSALLKMFLVGTRPRALAVYYFVEFPLLLAIVVRAWRRRRMLLYLAEFCWVANVLGWVSVALELAHTAGVLDLSFAGATRIKLARAFFAIANGPLALSIVMNKNVLVFHDVVRTSGLFIHFSPALASWALRWYDAGPLWALDHAAPGGASLLTELYINPLCAYGAWWAIYAAWLIAVGHRLPGDGPAQWGRSSFADVREAVIMKRCGCLAARGGRGQAVAYLLLHGAAVSLGLALPLVLYQSFALHTLYIGGLLLAALTNGARYYRYAFGKKMAVAIVREIAAANALGEAASVGATSRNILGECSFIYRYVLRESCSQFDCSPYHIQQRRGCPCMRWREPRRRARPLRRGSGIRHPLGNGRRISRHRAFAQYCSACAPCSVCHCRHFTALTLSLLLGVALLPSVAHPLAAARVARGARSPQWNSQEGAVAKRQEAEVEHPRRFSSSYCGTT